MFGLALVALFAGHPGLAGTGTGLRIADATGNSAFLVALAVAATFPPLLGLVRQRVTEKAGLANLAVVTLGVPETL